jgi:hypothetical protein
VQGVSAASLVATEPPQLLGDGHAAGPAAKGQEAEEMPEERLAFALGA